MSARGFHPRKWQHSAEQRPSSGLDSRTARSATPCAPRRRVPPNLSHGASSPSLPQATAQSPSRLMRSSVRWLRSSVPISCSASGARSPLRCSGSHDSATPAPRS
eukprot:Amastigsp_a687563_4.p3 type:complete len:105 gc:universal Amastigsp_a687563_4:358-672(+)